ncbi:MAG: TrmH family RNA methyltransferase [Candidatus Moraniibacteriota bacterium]
MILILDNLRSAYNVGALFRSADGAGVTHVYLVGITPPPPKPDQAVLSPAEKALRKTALGAERVVPWSSMKSPARLITRLKARQYEIIALEEGTGIASIDYRQWRPKRGCEPALIVGNEVAGIAEDSLATVDTLMHLPMRGMKHSLNVSVAGSIALYHLSATMETRVSRD